MYGGVNSVNALRMLNTLYQANQPPPPPPTPIRAPRPAKAKAPRLRPPTPSSSESESDSDYSDSEVSSSEYEDTDIIYKKVVEDAKCPHVSPAGLKDKKTSKEAAAYLKTKNCPELPKLKKVKSAPVKIEEPKVEPMPSHMSEEKPKVKKVTKKVSVAEAPAPAPVAAPAPAPVAAPAKAGKTKRAPTAYNLFVSKAMKEGKSMKEAAALYKAQKA
jgi:hypothetical protein